MKSSTFVFALKHFSILALMFLAVLFPCGGRHQHAADDSAANSSNTEESGNSDGKTLTGRAAFGDFSTDAPGVRRLITPADLPKPYATRSVDNGPGVVSRPSNAWPKVPAGFKVEQYMTGLSTPRLIRTAPNGDVFVAESYSNRVKVLRPGNDPTK